MKNEFCIIIPARLKSKRLPNKPLLMLKKKTLIEHTLNGIGNNINPEDIYIFTDSNFAKNKIRLAINKKYKNIFSIKKRCYNGTERSSHGMSFIKKNYNGYLILSCDFFSIKWKLIKMIFSLFKNISGNNLFAGTTAHVKIKDKKVLSDKSVMKVVMSKTNEILYLSRNQIPSNYKKKVNAYSHHGPVCLKKEHLTNYKNLKNTNAQISEDNEWLKIIENGYKIKSILAKNITREINNKNDFKFYNKK